MLFNKKKSRRNINKGVVNMSSMIDVTFLLLIYFLVTTVLTPPEDELNPALDVQKGVGKSSDELEPQIIEVVKRGNDEIYLIGSQAISSREALFEVLSKLPHEPGLIVKVNGTTTVAIALAAIQEGRNAGFDKVTYVPTTP